MLNKDENTMYDVSLIIRQHHEWPDGSGFPAHLKENQISALSAVFIICHSFLEVYFHSDQDPIKIINNIRRTLPEKTSSKFLKPLEILEDLYALKSEPKKAA